MKSKYRLFFVFFLFVPFIGMAQGQHIPDENGVYSIVDEKPVYPGGEKALREFIAENIKYPEDAKTKKISGKVYVSFVVDEKGNVAKAKIARGVDASLDQEALRVVKLMNGWKAGKEDGKLVQVRYTIPINFETD